MSCSLPEGHRDRYADPWCYIPLDSSGHYNKTVQQRLSKAGKISFLDSGLVWIIHKAPLVRQVYDVQRQHAELLVQGPINVQDTGDTMEAPDLQKLTEHNQWQYHPSFSSMSLTTDMDQGTESLPV